MRRIATILALAALAGCGGDGGGSGPDPADEPTDAAARAPDGWRTVTNAPAGFTLAAPRTWSARTSRAVTRIRSDDGLAVVTVAADRSDASRERSPAEYARETLAALPSFTGSTGPDTSRVAGSPYPAAVVTARGRVAGAIAEQLITVAAFARPERAMYAAVVFRNARVRPRFNAPVIERMLRSFRARAPDVTP